MKGTRGPLCPPIAPRDSPPITKATVQAFPSNANRSLQFTDTTTTASAEVVRSFAAQTGPVTLEFDFYVSSNWFRFLLRGGSTAGVEMYTKDGQLIYRNARRLLKLVNALRTLDTLPLRLKRA